MQIFRSGGGSSILAWRQSGTPAIPTTSKRVKGQIFRSGSLSRIHTFGGLSSPSVIIKPGTIRGGVRNPGQLVAGLE